MANTYDLAIIGAGMIGSCAAWLARKLHPEWKIVLLDRSLAGHGASLYSASLDIPFGHTALRRSLASRSRALFASLVLDIAGLPIENIPVYSFIRKNNSEYALQQFVEPGTRIGTEKELEHLKNKIPGLFIAKDSAFLVGTKGSFATRNSVASKIAEAFNKLENATLIEGTEINKIEPFAGRYKLIPRHGQTINAHRVIAATGPWITQGPEKQYAQQTGIRIKKIIAFHINVQPASDAPVLYFFDEDAFLLPKYKAGIWLFSFTCDHWDVTPDISQLYISEKERSQAMEILKKYYPAFIPHCTGGRFFCDGYTADGQPVTWKVPDKNNYIIAAAGSGSGYRLGPAIAEQALALLA